MPTNTDDWQTITLRMTDDTSGKTGVKPPGKHTSVLAHGKAEVTGHVEYSVV